MIEKKSKVKNQKSKPQVKIQNFLRLAALFAFTFMLWHNISCYAEAAASPAQAENAPEASSVVPEIESLGYEELVEKYKEVKADRDNVLVQTHRLLQFKRDYEKNSADLDGYKKQIEELTGKNNALGEDIKSRDAKFNVLYEEKGAVERENAKLAEEKAALEELTSESKAKETIDRLKEEKASEKRELEARFGQEIKELKASQEASRKEKEDKFSALEAENRGLEKKIVSLTKEIEKTKDEINKKALEGANLKEKERERSALEAGNKELEKKIVSLTKDIEKLKEDLYKSALEGASLKEKAAAAEYKWKNSQEEIAALRKEVKNIPAKFDKLARHNKVLLSRTADLHYNTGVFYSEKKDYVRAAKEFKQVIDLRPNDKDAVFNLGLIYAEFDVDRERAIEYLKRYLQLDNKTANANWARSYILKWESWRESAKDILR